MKRNSRGFTLIEVMAVIAIIGVLAAMTAPAVGSLMERTRKSRVASNMRQIALTFTSVMGNEAAVTELNSQASVAAWGRVLAKWAGITPRADWYLIREDPNFAGQTLPKLIPSTGATFGVNISPSVYVIKNLNLNNDPSTTPIAYTRGITVSGSTWANGAYGDTGGFVVFLDGSVEFYSTLANNLIAPAGTVTNSLAGATGFTTAGNYLAN